MFNWLFRRSSSSGCPEVSGSKKRKLAELSDGTSSSASPQDSGAKHRRKEARQVNDSLDQLGEQSDIPTMQVLFFHGLPLEDEVSNVHLATWDNGDGFIWPQAWLVEEFPGAQIFFVKYGAALANANFNMNNIGENLISDLLQANIGQVPGCPVVLVGHCIGGLVIKELCCKAHEELHSTDTSLNDRAKKLEAFLDRVRGIFYYSTPHHGILKIPAANRFRHNAMFKYFEILSTDTSVLNSNFSKLCKRYRKWKIEGVGESLPLKSGVFQNVLVVLEASAREGVQHFNLLNEDHFSICKPKTNKSGGFYHLTGLLGNIAKEEIELQEQSRPENIQHLSKSIVGIQIPLQEVKEKLKDVSTLGLTGMGGSGKTTLAKAAFNELGCKFEYTSFVPDVKFITGRVDTLKEEVWKHLYCNGKKVIGEMRWSQLIGKRLLLILDDVSDVRDITVLSEIAQGSSLESRFIATSRESDLFEHFYKVPLLDKNNLGRELFMSYAFPNNETPPSKLMSLIGEIVKKCEGLPLTLEVLGKWLRRTKDEEVWEQTLIALDKAELVTNFNERLWAKLRPSINGLQANEKQMFLDATTFFYTNSVKYGFWTLRKARAAWRETYGGSERLLWQTLVDRSLVYDVGENEKIKVHEQLLSLGRKMAKESNGNIEVKVLEITIAFRLLQSTNELDKKNIYALQIEMAQTDGEENHSWQSIADEGNSEQISSGDGQIHIASLALQELKNLRYLDIYGDGEIDGAAEASLFPSSLIVLRCFGLKILNLDDQRRLAVLEISGVESLPSSIGQLSALRFFNLFSSPSLKSIPEEIGDLSNLEVLYIWFCKSLQSLPEKLGQLWKLKSLNLWYCRDLRTLPKSFGNLSALESLEIDGCGFETLPESFGQLTALNYLEFDGCSNLGSLPDSFGHLPALADLKFIRCENLKSLPETFGHLSALSRLEFLECSRLQSLPESLGNLPVLRHLALSSCDVLHALPESLGQLAKLEYLAVDDLTELKRLPDSLAELGSLRHLTIAKLWSLKSIPDYIRDLPSLHTLELGVLPHVEELPPWLAETGVNRLRLSRKVFQTQGRHFSLTRDEVTSIKPIQLVSKVHSVAMATVRTSDYEGALAELELDSLGIPELDGFLLQKKGIIKRMMRDLHGALEDLTAALECFSKVKDGHHYTYDSWKHRGYVNFLMGDMEGAENDGKMALKLQLDYRGSVLSANGYDSLGNEFIEYMHFRLETLQAMEQHEGLVNSTHYEVLQKVKVPDFQGALASFDVIIVLLLRHHQRAFFLQERGVLKRLAGDLDGALEDLTASLEIDGEAYDCLKHRGYVKYLLGDVHGARLDAERCLTVGLPDYYRGPEFLGPEILAGASVAFMEFNLE